MNRYQFLAFLTSNSEDNAFNIFSAAILDFLTFTHQGFEITGGTIVFQIQHIFGQILSTIIYHYHNIPTE
jgi:hypothetical protein